MRIDKRNHRHCHSHSWDNVTGVLHQFVEVREFLPSLKLLQEVLLQMRELITDAHVWGRSQGNKAMLHL